MGSENFRQPAKFVVVVGVRQPGGVEQDVPDTGHQLVQELAPLGVVEERTSDGGDLDEAGERERGEGDRQRRVEVEEELQGAELQESWPPARWNLEMKKFGIRTLPFYRR